MGDGIRIYLRETGTARVQTGFKWPRIGSNGSFCEYGTVPQQARNFLTS